MRRNQSEFISSKMAKFNDSDVKILESLIGSDERILETLGSPQKTSLSLLESRGLPNEAEGIEHI